MSFPATLPAAILDPILDRLALLFMSFAVGDVSIARGAAAEFLASYHPETINELRLAAEIVSFSWEVLEALCQSADKDLALNSKLRLRAGAVGLSRQCNKALQKLEQLQRGRRANAAAPARQPEPPAKAETPPKAETPAKAETPTETVPPEVNEALAIVASAAQAAKSGGKYGGLSYAQHLQKRLTAKRLADKARKQQAETDRKSRLVAAP